MTDASEGAHMGHPDFRVSGRIFATLSPDNKMGMVQLTPEEQQEFIRQHPETFAPASGAWGRGGSTMVHLASADQDIVGEAMTLAWQGAVRKAEARAKPSRSKSDPRKKPKRSR